MLQIVYYSLLIINIIYAVHFALPFVIGLWKKNKVTIETDKQCQFAILIPARNEEIVIGNLIDSLKQQNYPIENYQIYVLINHCTDHTKQIAIEKGVNIIDCPNTVKSKGDVLSHAFQVLQKETFDAYLILDADNLAHPDFCRYMNISYQSGHSVAQSFRDSKNRKENWLSGGYSIFYFIQNIFFYTRKKLGISANFSGTGMMISKQLIDDYGYSMTTLTEDMEYSAFVLTHNITIDFVSNAIIYDEQPNQFSISWKQRKRWTTGVYQCLKKYFKVLWKGKTNRMSKLDLFFIFFSPLLQVLTCTVGAINIIYVVFKYGFLTSLYSGLLLLLLAYTLICLFAVFILECNHKNSKEMKLAILLFPIFLSTWIPIQFICLIRGVDKWEHISHKADVKIEEV